MITEVNPAGDASVKDKAEFELIFGFGSWDRFQQAYKETDPLQILFSSHVVFLLALLIEQSKPSSPSLQYLKETLIGHLPPFLQRAVVKGAGSE